MRVQRARIIGVAGVLDVHHAAAGKDLPCPTGPAGQYAIHHVDAPLHGAHNIIGLADTHQVARLVHGQLVRCKIQHAEHRRLPFTHRKATDCVAVKFDRLQCLCTLRAQILFQATLLDAKKRMTRSVTKSVARALCPAHRQFHAFGDAAPVRWQCGALIKTHHDIRAQKLLYLHRPLGRQLML